MKVDELVSKYIMLRDKKAEMKKEYEGKAAKVMEVMDKIEAVLLKTFQDTGSDSIKTEMGTAFKSTRSSATVADRDAYFGWVLADPEERMMFVESRANKTAVEQYKAANDDLPPGLNWREEVVVNVRRS